MPALSLSLLRCCLLTPFLRPLLSPLLLRPTPSGPPSLRHCGLVPLPAALLLVLRHSQPPVNSPPRADLSAMPLGVPFGVSAKSLLSAPSLLRRLLAAPRVSLLSFPANSLILMPSCRVRRARGLGELGSARTGGPSAWSTRTSPSHHLCTRCPSQRWQCPRGWGT